MTALPVLTDSDSWPVTVMGLGESPRPREGKVTSEGEPTYTTGAVLMLTDRDGRPKAQKTASVNVVKPASIYEAGVAYRAQGRVWVMPYVPNGQTRVALSVTVEQLVPVQSK